MMGPLMHCSGDLKQRLNISQLWLSSIGSSNDDHDDNDGGSDVDDDGGDGDDDGDGEDGGDHDLYIMPMCGEKHIEEEFGQRGAEEGFKDSPIS